jgi:hypothetical protein
MYPWAFDGRRKSREGVGSHREQAFERQRLFRLFGREECERNLGKITFFAPQTCPEGGVDNRLNGRGVWQWRHVLLSLLACGRNSAGKVLLHSGRDGSRVGVCRSCHRWITSINTQAKVSEEYLVLHSICHFGFVI